MGSCRPPIYLHSTWRSGSTYVWAKFRERADTCCFFEPLNEHLADATPDFVDRFQPWSYANHPDLAAPYLEEYRPMLAPGGGIEGFPAALAFGRFRANRDDHLPDIEAWFARLVGVANGASRRTVFGCVRTDLRLDWCRHRLEGCHIAVRRDPRARFLSCLQQAVSGNRYFLERSWVILGLNREDAVFDGLRRLVDLPVYDGPEDEAEAFFARSAWTTDWSRLYFAFYGLQLVAADHVRSADMVLDLDRMSENSETRLSAEAQVEALTGLRISFADCRPPRYEDHLRWSSSHFEALEDRVRAIVPRQTFAKADQSLV